MMNRELYPDNWEEIAFGMKQLTDWTCEHCGHAHDPAHGYTLTVQRFGYRWDGERWKMPIPQWLLNLEGEDV